MTRIDRVELTVLVLGSVLLGILTAAFLMIRVGGFPFPITAVIACAVNLVIYRLAASYTESGWQFAPLAAWTLVTVLAMLPVFGNGSLITGWRLLLLLILGAGIPAYHASNARLKHVVASVSDRP